MNASPSPTAFAQFLFWVLVSIAIGIPVSLFLVQLAGRQFARSTMLVFGVLLTAFAGMDLFHLRALSIEALQTPCLADDLMFSSALSIALYVLPAVLGAWGANAASHAFVRCFRPQEGHFEEDPAEQ